MVVASAEAILFAAAMDPGSALADASLAGER
jgi:hypothetical protein